MANDVLHVILILAMAVLALCMAASLYRSIVGPSIVDRIMGVNMVNTQVMLFIVILSLYLGEGSLVDIALIYGLIGFVAVVVFCKVFIGADMEKKVEHGELTREEAIRLEDGEEEEA